MAGGAHFRNENSDARRYPMTIYAIGDIHGQIGMLHDTLELIEADGGDSAHIVFLGDYTDRGPDSRAVLDLLVDGRDTGKPWTFIKGNHDRMFEWFMSDYPKHDAYLPVELNWLNPRLGGDTALASYGVEVTQKRRMLDIHADARHAVPQDHIAFLRNLQLSYETDDVFFAHAGIRPQIALAQQSEHDLLWIRQEFHHYNMPHPKLIVHGHTPIDAATHYGNRLNLDTGAGYGQALSVAVFEGDKAWVLTGQGRVPLTP